MQLNHLDLPVPDVAATAAFFTDHLGFTLLDMRGNAGLAVLQGDGGFVLVLTRRQDAAQRYPDNFHIGFLLDSHEAVHAAYARLTAAGISGLAEPKSMRGATLFYFTAPGEILVEISYRG